jgi:hypothetical protein
VYVSPGPCIIVGRRTPSKVSGERRRQFRFRAVLRGLSYLLDFQWRKCKIPKLMRIPVSSLDFANSRLLWSDLLEVYRGVRNVLYRHAAPAWHSGQSQSHQSKCLIRSQSSPVRSRDGEWVDSLVAGDSPLKPSAPDSPSHLCLSLAALSDSYFCPSFPSRGY